MKTIQEIIVEVMADLVPDWEPAPRDDDPRSGDGEEFEKRNQTKALTQYI